MHKVQCTLFLWLFFKIKHNMETAFGLTVNSKIFARTLFSWNFPFAKFRENKTLVKINGKITVVY